MESSPAERKFADFFEAFCHHFDCRPDDYERTVFFMAIPPVRRPFVFPLYHLAPDRFDLDHDIIEELGKTRTRDEFSGILDEFHNAMRVERSRLKRFLGMRIQGSRLMDIREELDHLIAPAESRRKLARGDAPVPAARPTAVVARPTEGPGSADEIASRPAGVTKAAYAPSESRSVTLRKVKQASAAIMEGRAVKQVLDSAGLTEEQFLELLAADSAGNPSFRWLREQLLQERRLKAAEEEIARLNRAVADQSREIGELRDRLARPVQV